MPRFACLPWLPHQYFRLSFAGLFPQQPPVLPVAMSEGEPANRFLPAVRGVLSLCLCLLVLCAVVGRAQAQDVKVTVQWDNDYTVGTALNTAATQNGDPVAGPAKIHVRLHKPLRYVEGSAQVTDVEIREGTDTTRPRMSGAEPHSRRAQAWAMI